MKTISPVRSAIILTILAMVLAAPAWAAVVNDGEAVPDQAAVETPANEPVQEGTTEIVLPWDGRILLNDAICDCVLNCFDMPYPNGCIDWCCVNEWVACRSICY